MPEYIQIEGDPTKWLLPQPFQTGQLTDQPLRLYLSAPVVGYLVLSGRHHSIAVGGQQPDDLEPHDLNVPNQSIYLPTPHGISEGHTGYELPASADLDNLASQIEALMRDGHKQTIALNHGGTLVLNGATLSFVVLCMQFPPEGGGPMPHDSVP